MLKLIDEKDSTKGDWSSGMIPVLGTGGPGFNSRIAPFLFISIFNFNFIIYSSYTNCLYFLIHINKNSFTMNIKIIRVRE